MTKGRLEAFSDGVLAIVITIMVLELKVPHSAELEALKPLWPVALSYLLSFVYLAIYWNNHHHLLQRTHHVNGSVLWANMHLLFWLSLVPFTTAWMGENGLSSAPVALYGGILLFAGVAYYILTQTIISVDGPDSAVAKAVGRDVKGKASLGLYALAIAAAFWEPIASCAIYAGVGLMWLVPDRRMAQVES